MSAPDELRQLADRFHDTARYMYPHEVIVDDITAAEFEAAAVALRHHADLTAAIGDPDEHPEPPPQNEPSLRRLCRRHRPRPPAPPALTTATACVACSIAAPTRGTRELDLSH